MTFDFFRRLAGLRDKDLPRSPAQTKTLTPDRTTSDRGSRNDRASIGEYSNKLRLHMTWMRQYAEGIGDLTVTAANHLVVGSIRALSVGGLGPNGSHDRLALEVVDVRLRWVGRLGAAGLEHVVDVEVVGVLDRCLHG